MAEAVALWSRAFPDMTVRPLDANDPPTLLRVVIAGQPLNLLNSAPVHDFTFTPSISLVITCDRAAEVDRLAGILGDGGKVLMPLDDYPFSSRYTWLADRFGVNWQIMLARQEGP